MIIPPEYYHLGALPPHWIIDALMKHLNQDYYIGLLSAASLYGATEQQPMVFQVITNKKTRTVKLERTSIEFHVSKHCASAIKTTLTVPTGYVKISSKEQTLVDLVRFYEACGFFSNVALVIKSLAPECDPILLEHAIEQEKTKPVLQRLGYLLELINFPKLADVVEKELEKRRVDYSVLRPDFEQKTGQKMSRWKLIINDLVELE